MKCLIASVLVATGLHATVRAELTLVRDGAPAATIAVGQSPSTQAMQAAEELRSILRKMTGAELPLVQGIHAETGPVVLVGQAAARPLARQLGIEVPAGMTHRFAEEGYVVAADSDTLVLAGNETDPYEGTFYAVYDLLHALGCRWFFPGEFGEVIPRRRTIAVEPMRRIVHPELRVRDTWYSGHVYSTPAQQNEFAVWKRRNRMCRYGFWLNCTLPQARFLQNPVDNSTWRLLPKEQYWASHPHYYAMKAGGGRNDRFICMSNPGALQAAANTVTRFFKEHPGHHSFAFSPPDEPVLCHCAECTRAMHGGFSGEGHGPVSDAYFSFVLRLADAVATQCPDRWITTMAYYNRCRPPEGMDGRRGNLLIQLASIQQCSLHSYADADCPLRQEFAAMLRRWAELTAGQVFYEYDPHDWTHSQRPGWRSQGIADDLRLLKSLGGWGFSNEGQMNWLATGLNYYVRARLAWDLDLKAEDLVRDFCDRFFGPAAKPMRRYYTTVERAIRDTSVHVAGGAQADQVLAVFDARFLDRSVGLLEQARELAPGEPFRTRVAAFRAHFDRLSALSKAREAMARADYRDALDWGERMARTVKQVDNTALLRDAGPWGGSLSGTQIAANARETLPWVDGTKGELLGEFPSVADFRTDPGPNGVVQRWYLPSHVSREWRRIRLTSGWGTQGVLGAAGRPYSGTAWYRIRFVRARDDASPVRLYIPELRGSSAWVWCNGLLAAHVRKARGEHMTVDLSGTVRRGQNLLAMRVEGDGGLTLPPFLFRPIADATEGTEIPVFPSEWLFRLDPGEAGVSQGWPDPDAETAGWRSIPVPGWWENTSVGPYDGDAWYRVSFELPKPAAGKRLVLRFGAVDEEAWVYLNGALVGEHSAASTGQTVHQIWDKPFDVPIPDARHGERNVLVVRVRDSQLMGGIFKPVRLIALP